MCTTRPTNAHQLPKGCLRRKCRRWATSSPNSEEQVKFVFLSISYDPLSTSDCEGPQSSHTSQIGPLRPSAPFVHLQHVGGPPPPQTNSPPTSCQFTWLRVVLAVFKRSQKEPDSLRSQERPTREVRAGPWLFKPIVGKRLAQAAL